MCACLSVCVYVQDANYSDECDFFKKKIVREITAGLYRLDFFF